MHGLLFKDQHFVFKDCLKVNNAINTSLISQIDYFILFLTIKIL